MSSTTVEPSDLEQALVFALANAEDAEALATLEEWTRHADEDVRKRSFAQLIERSGRTGGAGDLFKRAAADPHNEVRSTAILTALRLMESEPDAARTFLPTVAGLLDDQSEVVRGEAYRFVLAQKYQEAAPLAEAIEVIRDAGRPVEARIRACQALSYSHGMAEVRDALLAAVCDAEVAVRRFAAQAIGWTTDKVRTLPLLSEALTNSGDAEVRLSVLWGIVELRAVEAVPLLESHLSHPDERFRRAAVTGLGWLRARTPQLRGLWEEVRAKPE